MAEEKTIQTQSGLRQEPFAGRVDTAEEIDAEKTGGMTTEKTGETFRDIASMTLPELENYVREIGEKPFRAKQLYRWMHVQLAASVEEMTNLPKAFRERLASEGGLRSVEPVEVLTSKLDGTRKYLFRLQDGNVIESVLMPYHHGNSVCISSQVGCRMGCVFCASTIGGRVRDLTASEMLGQVYGITRQSGERVDSVVIMGSGEPLDNYENLVRFIRLITDENGLNLSRRSITVSTCGLVPQMRRFADEDLGVTLALSLHASSQEKREKLMPIARRYALPDVMDACRYYFERTGRRLTFEYSLVAGVNDTQEDAAQLAGLLGGMNAHVNLIPVNPVRERSFVSPDRGKVEAFQHRLERYQINVTIRREMGRDINGACGQLRRSYLDRKDREPAAQQKL